MINLNYITYGILYKNVYVLKFFFFLLKDYKRNVLLKNIF